MKYLLGLFFLTLLVVSCQQEKKQIQSSENYNFIMEEKQITLQDPHSKANFNQVVLKHLHWTANVDFENKVIIANATWTIENTANAKFLLLDTRNLQIRNVLLNDKDNTQFELLEQNDLYGSVLKIELFEDTQTVSIDYNTSPDAKAIQWLSPQQTADKTDPFLFTQSQAILARSWLPCMDSPGVRFTYNADVTVPSHLFAVMSAKNPKEKSEDGLYHFEMNQPIPSYLFALAVGNFEYQSIGKSCGVYAEPSVLQKAANEFEDLPQMIAAAEHLYGPYRWEEYDLIVLPPSFPFGGMENPRITFATPTILAGDKSLTSLVAHELAHSWSGNLVTNVNWQELWLNEGFTVYFEQRIMEELYGKEYSEMLASLSYEGLIEELKTMNPESTKLYVNLENKDPDEGMNSIPYDKGYLFLRTIEEHIGREKMDAFLRSYFSTYGFKVMNTKSFIELLQSEIIKENTSLAEQLQVEQWIYEPGLPENHATPSSNKFATVRETIKDLSILSIKSASKEWSSHEWQHFIENLPRDISIDQMKALDEAFLFTQSGNSEIQFDWYQLSLQVGYKAAYPAIETFLINVGRRKFVAPLFKTMLATNQEEMARTIYKSSRENYHSVTYQSIDAMLGIGADEE